MVITNRNIRFAKQEHSGFIRIRMKLKRLIFVRLLGRCVVKVWFWRDCADRPPAGIFLVGIDVTQECACYWSAASPEWVEGFKSFSKIKIQFRNILEFCLFLKFCNVFGKTWRFSRIFQRKFTSWMLRMYNCHLAERPEAYVLPWM